MSEGIDWNPVYVALLFASIVVVATWTMAIMTWDMWSFAWGGWTLAFFMFTLLVAVTARGDPDA